VFVIDGTNHLSDTEFTTQLRFTYDIASNFVVGAASTHIGMVQMGVFSWLNIPLGVTLADEICPSGSCVHCVPCSVPSQFSAVKTGVLASSCQPSDSTCSNNIFTQNVPECDWDHDECCDVRSVFSSGQYCLDPESKSINHFIVLHLR
jgi:hypothetical protein